MALLLAACATGPKAPGVDDHVPANLSILFPDESRTVTLMAQLPLEEIARYLKTHPAAHVDVRGEARNSRSRRCNEATAQELTQLISNQLRHFGVNPQQIASFAAGGRRRRGELPLVEVKLRLPPEYDYDFYR